MNASVQKMQVYTVITRVWWLDWRLSKSNQSSKLNYQMKELKLC